MQLLGCMSFLLIVDILRHLKTCFYALMWSVSWLKGRNNREQPTLPENYFKMIAVEVFTVVSRCSFATVNTGTPPKMYNQLNNIIMSKCKTVTLRKRKIKNGTQYSLCLDYYPGYRDNITMRVITREALEFTFSSNLPTNRNVTSMYA